MFDFSLSWTFHIWLWSIIGNKVLGLKYVGTILSTWFIEVWSQSPYWNWMLSFPNFLKCEVVKEMACVVCCLFFFRQLLIMWLGSPQHNFFKCTSTLFFLFCEWVCVLSIYMGSSFGVDTTHYDHMGRHEISLY